MDYAYLAAIVAGAFTLIVEANRRFAEVPTFEPIRRFVILKDVKATVFGVNSERRMGFAFYVGCYLAAYVIILSSVKLQSLLLQTTAGQAQAGSNSQDQWSSVLFDNPNYGLPIFVSAAIISLLSMPMTSRVEPVLRGVAYFFAGIPGGFYRALDNLGVQLGEKPATAQGSGKLAEALGKQPAFMNLPQDVQDAVEEIERLQPYLSPGRAQLHWPPESADVREELVKRSDDLWREMLGDIAATGGAEEGAPALTAEALGDRVFLVRDNFKAAFALLCILTSGMHLSKGRSSDQLISAVRKANQSDALRNIALWCTFWATAVAVILALVTGAWVWVGSKTTISEQVWITSNAWQAVFVAGRAACLIGVPALLCIGVREAMRRLETWKDWSDGLPPAGQYLRVAVLPILACGPMLIAWEIGFYVLKQVVENTPEALTERNLATTIRLAYATVLLLIPTVVPLCFFVCAVADHADVAAQKAAASGAGRVRAKWIAAPVLWQLAWLVLLVSFYLLVGLYVTMEPGARPFTYDNFSMYVAKETLLVVGPLAAFGWLFACRVEQS